MATTSKTTKTPKTATPTPRRLPPVTIRQRPHSEEEWTAEERLLSLLGTLPTADLVELLASKRTMAEAARIMLADTGRDQRGAWVTFPEAAKIHNVVTLEE